MTASGLVFSAGLGEVLLIAHKTLGVYLQPGGHFDQAGETPLEVARREIREETGLVEVTLFGSAEGLPFYINTHAIPANPRKGEPAHYHHDCCYLFRCARGAEATAVVTEEGADCKWVSVDDLLTREPFTRLPGRIRGVLG